MELVIETPEWAIPLLSPARYKGAYGGRGSGKSHFFAELLVEEHVANPNQRSVCIREIQKSLQFSARQLIVSKIQALGVSHLFDITLTEIRSIRGNGIIIFQGMQDHTADSIKSLEGFDRAWVEEAQNLSARSLKLLRPTIRNQGSEIWFSWNPDQPDDPVDSLLRPENGYAPDAIVVQVNAEQNPFLPQTLREEMEFDRRHNPDDFHHVWEGGYNTKTHAQIFAGKWRVDEFEPGDDWEGPYYGLDFGFANDPSAGVKCWRHDGRLYVEHEAGRIGLELDDTAKFMDERIPGFCRHVVRADSARPESISYLKRQDPRKERPYIPLIESVKKWPGSVEDGIEFIKSHKEVVIHTRCREMQKEARLYSFKTDKRTGDILPQIEDANNHYWDAVRYALGGLIKGKQSPMGIRLGVAN